jgi:hypothetical protein
MLRQHVHAIGTESAVVCHAMLCCANRHVQDRPSIRYIRDVLRMRSSPLIELQFSAPSAELLVAMEAAGGAGVLQRSAVALHGCFGSAAVVTILGGVLFLCLNAVTAVC